MEGLEPAHLSALDPKSSVSTNFTTSAYLIPELGLNPISLFKNSVESSKRVYHPDSYRDHHIRIYLSAEAQNILFQFSESHLILLLTLC